MRINKEISYILVGIFFVFASSCDLAETNIDPGNLSEDQLTELSLILPSGSAHMAFNSGALGARNPGIVMQYFLGLEAQQQQYSQYLIPRNALDNFWQFGMYGGGMKDLNFIIERTNGEGALNAPYYSGIAKIYMAEALGMLTTMFGDIPYSEAFKGDEGNIRPIYDTQEQIFTSIQTLLDEAITELSSDGGDIQPGGDDVVFGGDPDSWIATAYSLKARYLLTEGNYTAASAALDNAITSNSGSALYPFASSLTSGNPLYSFGAFERPGTMAAHPNFISRLDRDPRAEYITPDDDFVGGYWASQASPLPLITYAEVLFMKAEIAARNGEDVTMMVQQAVRANMEEIGVPEEDIIVYNLSISAPTLEGVMNEKYKAVYPNTRVAWNDFRRTGFPTLEIPSDAQADFYSGDDVNTIPLRFIYPESEFLFNEENLTTASERQGFLVGGEEVLNVNPPVFD
ncbi:SusD/RagB family nutrient-binding outer membrane lipoprotein [Marinigracilibium pacificum]|uniref:SusD/RagB family nutrient-binding outer membrane lipoprotein n=1 Tax=Marinigracilibium pacificum TaxID=2729599 RepID=A0A848J8E8_9BACT|nr:SusD/RagB family nutrient-binding outer membrane lipoprotein [Marinigracilibium pacificum]NMM49342.1 SusD/RagB family nutrient-binding outer membrane lipoprotein [Marinigracilibium pacificum]